LSGFFFCDIKIALDVTWEIIMALLGLAVLSALVKRIDVLYVVPIGATISLVFFIISQLSVCLLCDESMKKDGDISSPS